VVSTTVSRSGGPGLEFRSLYSALSELLFVVPNSWMLVTR